MRRQLWKILGRLRAFCGPAAHGAPGVDTGTLRCQPLPLLFYLLIYLQFLIIYLTILYSVLLESCISGPNLLSWQKKKTLWKPDKAMTVLAFTSRGDVPCFTPTYLSWRWGWEGGAALGLCSLPCPEQSLCHRCALSVQSEFILGFLRQYLAFLLLNRITDRNDICKLAKWCFNSVICSSILWKWWSKFAWSVMVQIAESSCPEGLEQTPSSSQPRPAALL